MLNGWFDRLMMPGVAFDLSNPTWAARCCTNLKRIAGITPTGGRGGTRSRRQTAGADHDALRAALLAAAPKVDYYPLYHMNVATEEQRKAFIAKVRAAMLRF
jgi:putative NADPH-quinone reductase